MRCIFGGWYGTPQEGRTVYCMGALGELAPPEGYSTSTHLGFMSCGPSPRVRPRRGTDADADTSTDAIPADAHSYALADARADHRRAGHRRAGHRRAGRRAVGYALP
jgi:hypothetical protein